MIDPNDNAIYYCGDSSTCYDYSTAGGDGGDICPLAGGSVIPYSGVWCCYSLELFLYTYCKYTDPIKVASVSQVNWFDWK